MFKALMGGGRSSSDARSTVSSSSRRKTDSKSSSSRRSTRGDDRDRGFDDDESVYSRSSRRRGTASIAGDSVTSSYVTAEPDFIERDGRAIVERTPKRSDSDRESKISHRRERDRSQSPASERRKTRRDTRDGFDELEDKYSRRGSGRTRSGDLPATSSPMPSSAPGAQFATDFGAPSFSPLPTPVTSAPNYASSPAPYDPHVQQQFPGQFPETSSHPYFPPNNPAGAAADYYGDQGQSVSEQPGVRPQGPSVLPNTQAHLQAASSSANPPPEPSSIGQTGAAADYFADDFVTPETPAKPSKPSKPGKLSSKPPKPSKPSKPTKPSSNAIPAAMAAGAVAYGAGNVMHSSEHAHSSTSQYSSSYSRPPSGSIGGKPTNSHSVGNGVGAAAAGGAVGYMLNHQHHSSNPEYASYGNYAHDHYSTGDVVPYGADPTNPGLATEFAGNAEYAAHPAYNPGFYPHGTGKLAMQHRPRDPLTRFADFWRDPEAVGRFEDYTEAIGVCRDCFEPGSSSMSAPRKHRYQGRRHSADRLSSGSSSRISKLNRYQSSEDDHLQRRRSQKTASWLPGVLGGSLFAGKEFHDSYSVRSGQIADERASSYDERESASDRRSYTSRGVVRRSGRSSPIELDRKRSRRTRSRSRSSSRSGHRSYVKEAAIGAAVGSAALAAAKSSHRNRSRSPSRIQRRKDSSSESSVIDVSRSSGPKSVGGFTSFFTSSSENRTKKSKSKSSSQKKRRGFFSFSSSSSSSLDNDLAFGTGFAKKPTKTLKKKNGKKAEDVDAALLGLSATATALAASSPHGRSRSTGQIMTSRDPRYRNGNYTSSANEDDDWVDAESEDQSASSVSSALAFGGSSAESGSDSSRSGFFSSIFGSKKSRSKKSRKNPAADAALVAGAGAFGATALASASRDKDRDSRISSSAGSLQHVYPVPTSDPSRFDVAKASPSVFNGQPAFVRPGAIPLQQPQPVTPVSQAVYTTQGTLPSILASSGPVPPIFSNEIDQLGPQSPGLRDPAWIPDDSSFVDRPTPRRTNSSPVFPVASSMAGPTRRFTTKDQASVSFNLTKEQEEQEHRSKKRNSKSRDDFQGGSVQLIDREQESQRKEAETRELERREFEYRDLERRDLDPRERRHNEGEEDSRRKESHKGKESSHWAEAAAVGAIGGAMAGSMASSHRSRKEEEEAEEALRREERRNKRREERRRISSDVTESPIVAAPEPVVTEPPLPAEDKNSSVEYGPVNYQKKRDVPLRRRSPQQSPVYDSYADFYAPEGVTSSPKVDEHGDDRDRDSSSQPNIVEIFPASESKSRDQSRDIPEDLPQFGPEPYENQVLPWPVPKLNFINPTPPHSINGSALGISVPETADAPTASAKDIGRRSEPEPEPERRVEPEGPVEPEPQPEPTPEPEPKVAPEPPMSKAQKKKAKQKAKREAERQAESEPVPVPAPEAPAQYETQPEPELQREPEWKSQPAPELPSALSYVAESKRENEEDRDEVQPEPQEEFQPPAPRAKSSTGSRVSWGYDRTHEYEVPSSSEQDPAEHDVSPFEESPREQPREFSDQYSHAPDKGQSRDIHHKPDVGADIDFAGTVAAATELAGFDPSVITNDPKYHTRYSPPGSEDERSFSPSSRWTSEKSRDFQPPAEQIREEKPGYAEPEPLEEVGGQHLPSSERRDRGSITQQAIEKLNDKNDPYGSPKNSVLSMPGGFDTAEDLREIPQYQDDSRSVFSAPPEREQSSSKSSKSRRSIDSDIARDNTSPVKDVFTPDDSKKEKKRSRSSRKEELIFDDYDAESNVTALKDDDTSSHYNHHRRSTGDTYKPIDDDIKSANSAYDEEERSHRRKHRHRSRDGVSSPADDDARSVVSAYDEDGEKSRHRRHRHRSGDSVSSPDDTKSTISGHDDDEDKSRRRKHRHRSRDGVSSPVDDDARSIVSAYDEDGEKSRHRRHRHRSGDSLSSLVDDDSKSVVSAYDDGEHSTRRKHRHRSSTTDSLGSAVDDDARSVVSAYDDDDKSRRRRHHHRRSTGDSTRSIDDETASVTSSPAQIDETRKRGKDEKEKSVGILRSLFSSKASAASASGERSRSSSLDKRSSSKARSDIGDDESSRHRKHRSSRHSSGGSAVGDSGSDRDSIRDDTSEYKKERKSKEERRRHRYEEIVDSGSRRDSEKDGKRSDYNDELETSFLGERPEMLAAAERDESGASGPQKWVEGAAIATAGLALGDELRQQHTRSRSTSPPAAEKSLELAPKSQSRPTSPNVKRDPDLSRPRRTSAARPNTESPTAVPLHFRRPPTSPGLARAVPVEPQTSGPPVSPSQGRHRRQSSNSTEFRESKEYRPLYLVALHGSAKVDEQPNEELPSLPSSKTSSRAPSVEDLRAMNDEDAFRTWDPIDLDLTERRKPAGLSISTDHTNVQDGDHDILDSQQTTPTAEHFGAIPESAKKEKPKYEFHSPSELLQDPAVLPEVPLSDIEGLPSAEGSVVGLKDLSAEHEIPEEHDRGSVHDSTTDAEMFTPTQARSEDGTPEEHDRGSVHDSTTDAEMFTPTQERSGFFDNDDTTQGLGFASVVDEAIIAASKENEKTHEPESLSKYAAVEPTAEAPPPSTKSPGFGEIVDAAVLAEAAARDKSIDVESDEPITAIEEHPPQQLEVAPASEAEIPKDFVSESSQKHSEPVESVPAEESKSKKKKNKKKNKKGQASDSIDSSAEAATTPASEEKQPPSQAAESEPQSLEPAVDPAVAPREVEPQSTTEIEKPVETLEATETVVAPALLESTETATVSETPLDTADAVTEADEQKETAGLSKKEKRAAKKKKLQQQRTENASVPEELADSIGNNPEPQAEQAVAGDIDAPQEIVPAALQNQSEAPLEETREISFGEEAPVADENSQDNTSLPASVAPVPVDETAETEDDTAFHEAVEEQPSVSEEKEKNDMLVEPSSKSMVDAPNPVDAPEIEPKQEEQEPQSKKKSKKNKKKNRQSVSDETITPSEAQPAPEPEAEDPSKEIEPEQLTSIEPASSEGPLASSEPQLPESEKTVPSDSIEDVSPAQESGWLRSEHEPLSQEPYTEISQSTNASESAVRIEETQGEPGIPPEVLDNTPAPKEPELPSPEDVPQDVSPEQTIETSENIQPAEEGPKQTFSEAEKEPEVVDPSKLSAKERRKLAKKAKKVANKDSVASIPDEEKPAEPETILETDTKVIEDDQSAEDDQPAEEAQGIPDSAAEEYSAPVEHAASTVEEANILEPEIEQSKELDPSAAPVEELSADALLESKQPVEREIEPDSVNEASKEPPAESSIVESKSQKKKRKKAEKDAAEREAAEKAAQEQQEREDAVAEVTPAVEAASAAEPEPLDSSEDIKATSTPEATVTEVPASTGETPVPAPIDEADVVAVQASPEAVTESETTKPVDDTLLPSEEPAATTEALQEEATEASPDVVSRSEEVETPRELSSTSSPAPEPEKPMSASQKKKEKRKKQKEEERRKSMQLQSENQANVDRSPLDQQEPTEPKAKPEEPAESTPDPNETSKEPQSTEAEIENMADKETSTSSTSTEQPATSTGDENIPDAVYIEDTGETETHVQNLQSAAINEPEELSSVEIAQATPVPEPEDVVSSKEAIHAGQTEELAPNVQTQVSEPTKEAEQETGTSKSKKKKNKNKSVPQSEVAKDDAQASSPIVDVQSALGEASELPAPTQEAPEADSPVLDQTAKHASEDDPEKPSAVEEALDMQHVPEQISHEALSEPQAKEETVSQQVTDTIAEPLETETLTQDPVEPASNEFVQPLSTEDGESTHNRPDEHPPAASVEAPEPTPEVKLSAKQLKKLKKKQQKQKALSMDSTPDDAVATAEPEKPDVPAEHEEEAAPLATPEAVKPAAEADPAKDLNAHVLQQSNEANAQDGSADEPEITSKDIEKITDQETGESNVPADDSTIANPTTEDKDSTEEKDNAETTTEPEKPMTAAQRRKEKKKAKKRESQVRDDADIAVESPAIPTTEPIPDATATDPAVFEPTVNDTEDTGPSGPVTAPSPAEDDDGKDNQSHDIDTPDITAKDLTSTDDIVSSQVEQPQSEIRFSDLPPQPVLERSFDSSKLENDGSQEQEKEVTDPIVDEADAPTTAEAKDAKIDDITKEPLDTIDGKVPGLVPTDLGPDETTEGAGEVEVQKEEDFSSKTDDVVEKNPMPDAFVNAIDVHNESKDVAEEVVPSEEVQLTREQNQPPLSKKQKKKKKEKQRKQLDEAGALAPIESDQPAEPEPPVEPEQAPEPERPAEPDQLIEPEQLAEPDHPVEAEQKPEPEQTPEPEQPSQLEKPAEADHQPEREQKLGEPEQFAPEDTAADIDETNDKGTIEAVQTTDATAPLAQQDSIDQNPGSRDTSEHHKVEEEVQEQQPKEVQAIDDNSTEPLGEIPSRSLSKKQLKRLRKAAQQADAKADAQQEFTPADDEQVKTTEDPASTDGFEKKPEAQAWEPAGDKSATTPEDVVAEEPHPSTAEITQQEEEPREAGVQEQTIEETTHLMDVPAYSLPLDSHSNEHLRDSVAGSEVQPGYAPRPEAEEELASEHTASSKKKNKNAKKAAAAAAATSAQDEKPMQVQTVDDATVNSNQPEIVTGNVEDYAPVDDQQVGPSEVEKAPLADQLEDDVLEKPVQTTENISHLFEQKDITEKANHFAEDDTPKPEMSAKDKRKAKKKTKKAQKASAYLDDVPIDVTPTEDALSFEPVQVEPVETSEAPAEEMKSVEATTSQPEPVSFPDEPSNNVDEPLSEDLEKTEATAPRDEHTHEISGQPTDESLTLPSQEASREIEVDGTTANVEDFIANKEAEVPNEDHSTDKINDPEVILPVTRKMSKKEKRKAKQQARTEELSNGDQESAVETGPFPIASKTSVLDLPEEPESKSFEEPQAIVESGPPQETEPELLSQADVPEAQARVVEPIEEVTPMSRKASKKAAKKAKKASQVKAITQEEDTTSASKESTVDDTIQLPITTERELSQDDEEWPVIEWEQNKTEEPEMGLDHPTEAEPVASIPASEAIDEYDESAIPEALRETRPESKEPMEEETWSVPSTKKAKKDMKSGFEEPTQATDMPPEKIEPTVGVQSEPPVEISAQVPATQKDDMEPPVRTTTPGGSKLAGLFPDLPRGGFRRSAVKQRTQSPKDSAEEENVVDLEANRDIAIPVSEAPLYATSEKKEIVENIPELPIEVPKENVSQDTAREAFIEDVFTTTKESPREPELPGQGEEPVRELSPSPMHSASKERSSMLFSSSPSTRTEDPFSPWHPLPSQSHFEEGNSSTLRRTPSVIHGRHQQTPRTWSLDESPIPATQSPSPPRSLFGGPIGEHESVSRPRTPLDTIEEQEPGDTDRSNKQHRTPRLEIKPEHVLPRPITPVRKFTDNALSRETWPTPENEEARRSQESLKARGESPLLKSPEQGMPVLKPTSSKGKLRRADRSTSSDLRGASRALASPSQPPSSDLDQLPSSSSYDPVTDKGKGPLQKMSDVYEGWGETPNSPRSPSRPPSVRRRRSMQHLQDLESRLDQLISDNRLLAAARDEAEDRLRNASVARRKSDQALNLKGGDLRDKEAEVEQLKNSVEWFQKEMARLTQENEALTSSNAALAAAHAEEVTTVRQSSTRALDDLRSQHDELSSQMEHRVRQEIEAALAQKDSELRRLRQELEAARDKVQELQQQISASVNDNALVFHDEDYFDAACQKLCGHVQQWVLRFSKYSDNLRCRSLSEVNDEKISDRFDNALLDGSDSEAYLGDRVRRRDVFMSVVMTMVWEYIFTRYLFGMDREQRQKLKSLEKQLGEVGPKRAVNRWRATTLTLLSRRPAFSSQRQNDTEAVALEIFDTLSRVLPPPSNKEPQLLESLRKVLRIAVNLSLEMRTQLAEFIMLPPLQPEYDTNGDLARQVYFNASLMNERSGETTSNEDLEAQQAVVRIVLFPLVVKKGDDVGEGDEEEVVCPAQVLVARPGKDKKLSRMMSGDRMSLDASKSVHSVAPSTFTMDMGSNPI